MDLEYHQLDLCNEHLRVRCPDRQRKLLASLAESGQQLPIVVVAIPNEPDRYRVIDGFKRIAALKLLGHDTVCATIWQLSEAEALVLDQSLRLSDQDTALEQGWLLAELESRFGYDLDDLARRFDRSTSWVSRRIALVEALPDPVQEQVRRGEVGAQVAMKFLVPMVRISTQACERMAAIFGRLKLQTREAGELYAAWRDASPVVRQRILDEPQLFLKAYRERKRPQQEAESRSPTSDLLRDLEMIQSIANRAGRHWRQAAPLMDSAELDNARHTLDRAMEDLQRLSQRIEREKPHAEQTPTHHDSGATPPGERDTGDRPFARDLPQRGEESDPLSVRRSAAPVSFREGGALPAADPGAICFVQGQFGPGP
jgi:ParB family chromosome partitioning protein